jgi:hypothetical protein
MIHENEFKKGMGVKEASSITGGASKKHGEELETWLREDINGVVNGFEGYEAFDMNLKKFNNNKFINLNGSPLCSDVMITNSTKCRPALIVESKGTINENIYGLLYFAKEYKRLKIPYCVVTKDTKRVFKTGDTKYLNFIKEAGNIILFINNHDNYDDTKKIFSWVDYSWNDYVKPYHKFNTFLFDVIKEHQEKNSEVNKFFDFSK